MSPAGEKPNPEDVSGSKNPSIIAPQLSPSVVVASGDAVGAEKLDAKLGSDRREKAASGTTVPPASPTEPAGQLEVAASASSSSSPGYLLGKPWVLPVTAFGVLALVIYLATQQLPVGQVILNTADDFESYLDALLSKNHKDYVMWYQANLFAQFFLILTSIGATILAAITTQRNAPYVKWWSVFFTAVTAFSAGVLTTFHVRDNLESFMDVHVKVTNLQARYLSERAKLFAELKQNKQWDANVEILKLMQARQDLRDTAKVEQKGLPELPNSFALPYEWLELQARMTDEASKIQMVRMRSWTNIGPQASPQRTPSAPSADGN